MKYTVNTETKIIELNISNPLKIKDLKKKLNELETLYPNYEITLINTVQISQPFNIPNVPNTQPYDNYPWNKPYNPITDPFNPLNPGIVYCTSTTSLGKSELVEKIN